MQQDLDIVVVTGASAGVGRATVREFAKRRARIGLVARGRDGLETAAREVAELGGEALVLPCDVADAECVESAAAQVEARWGRIDVWVNCAMSTVFATVMDTTPEEYRRVTDVTYLGSHDPSHPCGRFASVIQGMDAPAAPHRVCDG